MKLIIDIPEEIYKASQKINVKYEDTIQIPLEVIANSKPLDEIMEKIEAVKILRDIANDNESTVDVLDKIRAEIDEKYEKYKYLFDTDFMGTKDLEWVLSVIDKYREGANE